jgi:hypothetical protein
MGDRIEGRIILPIAIAGLAFLTHFGHYTQSNAFDFYQFWIFGQAARQSVPEDIYAQAQRAQIGDAYYQRALGDELSARHRDVAAQRRQPQAVSSPLLYALFGVCSTGDFEVDYITFQLFAAISAVVAVLLLGRALGYSWAMACLWLGALLTWFGPFFGDVEVGNVNRFQLLLIAAYVWLQQREHVLTRDLVGGIVLSAMITFKPNLALAPALLLVTWLIAGDFGRLLRQSAGVAVGGLTAIMFTAWYFGGAACWTNWLAALRDTTQNMQLHSAGNVSFAWWLSQRMGTDLWLILTGAMAAIVLVAAAIGRRNPDAAMRDTLIVAAAAGIALLASPLTWQHYLILAAPLWLIMLMPDARFAGALRSIGVLVLLAVGCGRLIRDFAGLERAFEMLIPVWWMTIALPLIAVVVVIACPRERSA